MFQHYSLSSYALTCALLNFICDACRCRRADDCPLEPKCARTHADMYVYIVLASLGLG